MRGARDIKWRAEEEGEDGEGGEGEEGKESMACEKELERPLSLAGAGSLSVGELREKLAKLEVSESAGSDSPGGEDRFRVCNGMAAIVAVIQ